MLPRHKLIISTAGFCEVRVVATKRFLETSKSENTYDPTVGKQRLVRQYRMGGRWSYDILTDLDLHPTKNPFKAR